MIKYTVNDIVIFLNNFELYEVRCHGDDGRGGIHDCGLMILDPEFLFPLGVVRVRYDMPIVMNSWTCCWVHNAEVGGSDTSKHPLGRAGDLAAAVGGDMPLLREICRDVFPYTIDGPGYIHCDVRDPKR